MVRACADDVGCFLSHRKHLAVVTSCFDSTTASMGLALGPPKCKIAPCYSRHSKALEFMLRKFLAERVPGAVRFGIAQTAIYLGIWMGPAANTEQWRLVLAKFKHRV